MMSDSSINIDISPMKNKDKDNKDEDKYVPPKEFRTIFKGTYSQPLQRMWRIIYDDGRLPIEERETFLEEYTLKGKTDFNCTDWEAPDKSQHTDCYHPNPIKRGWKRNISYIMDIDSPIGPKHTRTSAEEEIQVFEPTKIIFESTSSTPDVPYGSSFNTIIIQCLFEDEITHETTFEVYGFIRWTKSCVIKKSIEKFAFNGMIDHQKEMDEALKNYIEANPDPRYVEDLIQFSPRVSYIEPGTESKLELESEPIYYSFKDTIDDDNEERTPLLFPPAPQQIQQFSQGIPPISANINADGVDVNTDDGIAMTTLNNNLVYDNILEIKEKALEKNRPFGRTAYCSSLANTYNSTYVNVSSERSVVITTEERDREIRSSWKEKEREKYNNEHLKWWWFVAAMLIVILTIMLVVVSMIVVYVYTHHFEME